MLNRENQTEKVAGSAAVAADCLTTTPKQHLVICQCATAAILHKEIPTARRETLFICHCNCNYTNCGTKYDLATEGQILQNDDL